MGACKCGGNCNDCKKIKARTIVENYCDPHFTGNIKYDGIEFICENNTALNLSTGNLLNDIILAHATALCENDSLLEGIAISITEINDSIIEINEALDADVFLEDYADIEEGGSIAASTTANFGLLTVVVDGKYLINWNINVTLDGTAEFRGLIRKTSGTPVDYGSGRGSNGSANTETSQYANGSGSLILDLIAGETLVIKVSAFSNIVTVFGYNMNAIKL
jgi:hypothetical protein